MRRGSRVPGTLAGRPLAARVPGDIADPNLDTLLHKRHKLAKRRSVGRLFFRSIVGLLLPGDYWFITFTSTPKSPKLEGSWRPLRVWLKRHYPASPYLYCWTDEGHGVIHLIMRAERRPDINQIRAAWFKIHGAKIVNIKEVYDKKGLAAYISDQRRRKGMAIEMSSQETIIKWRMSRGWVPKAFMKVAGQFWFRYGSNLDDITRYELLRDWIIEVYDNYEKLKDMPFIHKDRIYWCGDEISHIKDDGLIDNDKTFGSSLPGW